MLPFGTFYEKYSRRASGTNQLLDACNDRAFGAVSTSKKLARVIVRQVYNRRNPKLLDTSKVDF